MLLIGTVSQKSTFSGAGQQMRCGEAEKFVGCRLLRHHYFGKRADTNRCLTSLSFLWTGHATTLLVGFKCSARALGNNISCFSAELKPSGFVEAGAI